MGVLDPNMIAEVVSGNTMYPPSPDQGGMSPVVENAPQSKTSGGGLKGFLTTAFKNFMSGAGEAGEEAAGINDAAVKKANVKSAEFEDAYRSALTAESRERVAAAQAGRELVPFIDPASGMPIMGQDGQPVMMPRNASKSLLDYLAKVRVASINQGQGVPVDETVASLVDMPEMAGKPAGKALWSNINAALRARGYQFKDLGKEGLWLVDRGANKIKKLADSPMLQGMEARSKMYDLARVVPIVGADGRATYVHPSQAVGAEPAAMNPEIAGRRAYGVSLATGTEGDQIQSYRAFMGHLNDLYDYSKEFQTTGSPYANKPLNWLRNNAAGDPAIAKYLAKIEPVVKEYESFLLNNRALYAEDRESGKKILDENKTPAQIADVARSMAHTGAIRLGSANLRYRDVNGFDSETMIDPETGRLLEKFGQTETIDKYRATPRQVVRDKMTQSKSGLKINRDANGRIIGVE